MSGSRSHAARRRRVYYILPWLLIGLFAGGTRAQVEITITPSMVKGARAAPVTILEFSDYQ